jgi:IS5 family transposase
VFLLQMDIVDPWAVLDKLIALYSSEGGNGRPPFALETMLHVHFMQQWFSLLDPAMEKAFFDTPLYPEFAQLSAFGRLPDESTILRFRHRLEKHKLADQILATVNELLEQRGLLLRAGTAVDATLFAASSSSKGKDRVRDPEMHSNQKGKECHFVMKAQIGFDADAGLVHTVQGTSGNVADVTGSNSLLHGQETDVFVNARYQVSDKRSDAKTSHKWHVGMRKKLDKENKLSDELIDRVEKVKAGIHAKVELSNLWMARHKLMGLQTMSVPKKGHAAWERLQTGQVGCELRPEQVRSTRNIKKRMIVRQVPRLVVAF